MDNEMITIPLSEYTELLEDSRFLDILVSNGVDNWEFYDESVTQFQEEDQ